MHAAMKKAVKRQKEHKKQVGDPKELWKAKKAKKREQIRKVVALVLGPVALISILGSLMYMGVVRFGNPGPLADALRNPAGAKSLRLNGYKLTEVPPEVEQLTALKELNLDNNAIGELPASIKALLVLEDLSIQYNQLKTLPKELAELPKLKHLRLQDNQLTALPDELTGLKDLETLSVSKNSLSTLPDKIGKMKSLKALNLAENQISRLPSSMESLTQLQVLDISGNPISELPDLSALKKLGRLKARKTRLTAESVEKIKSQLPDVRITQ